MLSSKNRFHRRKQLHYVHKKGTSVRGPDISLRYITGVKHENFRVSVVVSRKVSKKAVVRNRIRRRVYAIIRNLNPPLRNDVDLIISVFDESLASVEHAELSKKVTKLVDKAGLRSN